MFLEIMLAMGLVKAARNAWGKKEEPVIPPNVTISADGKAVPMPGFAWVTPEEGNFEVRWTPGLHWKEGNLVAGTTVREWMPAPGYRFRQPGVRDCLDVVWTPGLPHSAAPHVLAHDVEGHWRVEPGWRFVSRDKDDLRVEPAPERATRSGRAQLDPQSMRDLVTLGLEVGAAWAQVQETFRRLALVHHPDRFAGLGARAVDAAQQTFVRLRGAYERLRAVMGGGA